VVTRGRCLRMLGYRQSEVTRWRYADSSNGPNGGAAVLDDLLPAVGLVKAERTRRRVFTPVAIQIVRELASQGRSASEIACVIGSTAASVRVRCCQLQIKLSRRVSPSSVQTGLEHSAAQKLVVYMGPAEYAALARKAAQMQKSRVELAARLLEAIVGSDLYEAVLDNAE
jgi:hypothetical protein